MQIFMNIDFLAGNCLEIVSRILHNMHILEYDSFPHLETGF